MSNPGRSQTSGSGSMPVSNSGLSDTALIPAQANQAAVAEHFDLHNQAVIINHWQAHQRHIASTSSDPLASTLTPTELMFRRFHQEQSEDAPAVCGCTYDECYPKARQDKDRCLIGKNGKGNPVLCVREWDAQIKAQHLTNFDKCSVCEGIISSMRHSRLVVAIIELPSKVEFGSEVSMIF
ncbi:hypothetical protein BJ508DRAFT_312923 [Ascobolus immersus RN42]|uniref:Uncharacterized protein n=1 Tax=Ascobolus immersus RN42 TaxID=1160509 RepID=A0A3N4HKL3_ASCIM|nr:hypothetical protein BJ508DRAFT_312923 [Ascobolus immersus RN42]